MALLEIFEKVKPTFKLVYCFPPRRRPIIYPKYVVKNKQYMVSVH